MTDALDILLRRIAQLEGSINEMSRRMNNVLREARVLEIDAANGMAIVEGHGGRSKPVPWLQRAGSIRDWDPPAEGERVIMLSPGGDPGRAMILPGGYSGSYGAPHNVLGQAMRQVGSSTDLTTSSTRVIEAQMITLRGTVRIEGPVQIQGQYVTHNGKNIGHNHSHTKVKPGGGISGPPL